MNEQRIREIIKEEIAKLNEYPVIKDVHLHIHGDELKPLELFQDITKMQNFLLEKQILEKINGELT